jgi:hypothetical protein
VLNRTPPTNGARVSSMINPQVSPMSIACIIYRGYFVWSIADSVARGIASVHYIADHARRTYAHMHLLSISPQRRERSITRNARSLDYIVQRSISSARSATRERKAFNQRHIKSDYLHVTRQRCRPSSTVHTTLTLCYAWMRHRRLHWLLVSPSRTNRTEKALSTFTLDANTTYHISTPPACWPLHGL